MADAEERIIKASVPLDIVLFELDVIILSGELKVYTLLGDGAEGGSFATSLPVIRANNMDSSPVYTPQVGITTGGTYTGGTAIDLLWLKTSANTNKASGVGSGPGSERGVAPGSHYYRMQATGTVSGVFKARWEERPEGT